MKSFLVTFSTLMAGSAIAYLVVWGYDYKEVGWLLTAFSLAPVVAFLWGLYGIYLLGKRHGMRDSDV